MLRFMLPTCHGNRCDDTPGRSADGKDDEDSEGGHQKLRLRTVRSASRSHHPIINAAMEAPIATPIPTPSAVPTPKIIQVMVPPTRTSGRGKHGQEIDDRAASQVRKSDGFWLPSRPVPPTVKTPTMVRHREGRW
jgi:hypothetical protein